MDTICAYSFMTDNWQ